MCECCYDATLSVIANSAITEPTTDPVTLTVDRALTGLGVGQCFTLCIPIALLRNANTNTVSLTDTAGTVLPIWTRCTDQLRYDSLVVYADKYCGCCGGFIKLRCNLRDDPAPGHIYCKTCLPLSSFTEATA